MKQKQKRPTYYKNVKTLASLTLIKASQMQQGPKEKHYSTRNILRSWKMHTRTKIGL